MMTAGMCSYILDTYVSKHYHISSDNAQLSQGKKIGERSERDRVESVHYTSDQRFSC